MLTRRIQQMARHFPENGTKFLLENPLNVRELFDAVGEDWPDLVDWPHTTLDRTTYVQSDYRHVESDVVLRAPLRQTGRRGRRRRLLIYLLIEHQSLPERWMLLRVQDYVTQIYRAQLRSLQRRGTDVRERLQLVLPVVFYTGEQPWSELDTFADLIELSDRFPTRVPALSPLFLNLSAIPAGQLETQGGFFGWVLRLIQDRHARPREFRELLERVVSRLELMAPSERVRWRELLSYTQALVYHGRETAEHEELHECIVESVETDPRRKEVLQMGKTIADSLIKKGERKGRKAGRDQEAIHSRQKTLLLLLEERFGPIPAQAVEAVMETKEVSILDEWLKQFAKVQTVDEMNIPGL